MLQLYGNSRSRGMRCLWMLEEMGKPYQLMEKSTRADDLQDSEYLRLNPNARIPTLVDGIWFCGNRWRSTFTSHKNTRGRCTVPDQKSWVWLLSGASGPCWRRKRYCLICCSIAQCWQNLRAMFHMPNATSCY